ncbi:DUF4259 domain-containing protein [Dactylosporangium salmoneum]|uniref:DUF4259 domain-containing protein n=1 Tax=Dactylosporangium salmoneum TaxID=53361 RepID=UPI003CD05493
MAGEARGARLPRRPAPRPKGAGHDRLPRDDVPALAIRALDRIVGDDSEWRELWDESTEGAPAVAALQQLRTTIDSALDKR